jgi:hypothetical protein
MLILFAVAAGVPLLLAWLALRDPASTGRRLRLAIRFGLAPERMNQPQVARYLTQTRRWRTVGVAAAYIIMIAATMPRMRVTVAVLGFGWLAGAVIAETLYRATTSRRDAPMYAGAPWLRRVPIVLAGFAVLATVLSVLLTPAGQPWQRPVAWGAAALLDAVVMALGIRYVARRTPAPDSRVGQAHVDDSEPARAGAETTVPPDDIEVARVLSASSIAAIAAAGTLTAGACLAESVTNHLYGRLDTAAHVVVWAWILGSLAIAWSLRQSALSPHGSDRTRLAYTLSCFALVVVTSASASGYAIWASRPPFAVAAVNPTARIILTDLDHFGADAETLGVTDLNAMPNSEESQLFIGRVDFAVPANARVSGSYEVVVIDTLDNRQTRLSGPEESSWNGFMGVDVPIRYPWLSALADIPTPGGYTHPGESVGGQPGQSGPIAFVGHVRRVRGQPLSAPMVALIFVGPDQQIYWATRVPVTMVPAER